MSDSDGDRRSALTAPPNHEVASRMAVLAALALLAGALLGTFAAIVVIVAGLALLAMTAAARVNRARPTAGRRARPARIEPAAAPLPAARKPARRTGGPQLPRATH